MAAVSARTAAGSSRGSAARCRGRLPPPSRNDPELVTASITERGPSTQVVRHPG